jgi:hypothetical protein
LTLAFTADVGLTVLLLVLDLAFPKVVEPIEHGEIKHYAMMTSTHHMVSSALYPYYH